SRWPDAPFHRRLRLGGGVAPRGAAAHARRPPPRLGRRGRHAAIHPTDGLNRRCTLPSFFAAHGLLLALRLCAAGRVRRAGQDWANGIERVRRQEIGILIEPFKARFVDLAKRPDVGIAIAFGPGTVPYLSEADTAVSHDLDRIF